MKALVFMAMLTCAPAWAQGTTHYTVRIESETGLRAFVEAHLPLVEPHAKQGLEDGVDRPHDAEVGLEHVLDLLLGEIQTAIGDDQLGGGRRAGHGSLGALRKG